VISGYETIIKNRKIGKLVQCYVSRHTCLSQRKDVIDQSSTDRTQHLKFVLKIDIFCLNITIMQRVDGFREEFNDKLFLTEGKTALQKISKRLLGFCPFEVSLVFCYDRTYGHDHSNSNALSLISIFLFC
jgi:hypothetical protein